MQLNQLPIFYELSSTTDYCTTLFHLMFFQLLFPQLRFLLLPFAHPFIHHLLYDMLTTKNRNRGLQGSITVLLKSVT